jgi:hypothetical protein
MLEDKMDQLNEKLLEDREPDSQSGGSRKGSVVDTQDDQDKSSQFDNWSEEEKDLKQIMEENQRAREQLMEDL